MRRASTTPLYARSVTACAASIGILTASVGGNAAPLTSNTALPVAKGEFVLREQVVLKQSGDDASGADRDRTGWAVVSALGYGVTPRFAAFAVVPYAEKRLELTDSGQRIARSTRDIGDASLFGRYTAFQKDWPQRTLRVAPFLGLELPTGEDDSRDNFGVLPAGVQPG